MPITLDPSLTGEARQHALAIARVYERLDRDVTPRASIPFDEINMHLAELRYEELHEATIRIDLRGCPEDFRAAVGDLIVVLASVREVIAKTVAFQRRFGGWRSRIERWRRRLFGATPAMGQADHIRAELRLHIDAVTQALSDMERIAARYGVTDVPT